MFDKDLLELSCSINSCLNIRVVWGGRQGKGAIYSVLDADGWEMWERYWILATSHCEIMQYFGARSASTLAVLDNLIVRQS